MAEPKKVSETGVYAQVKAELEKRIAGGVTPDMDDRLGVETLSMEIARSLRRIVPPRTTDVEARVHLIQVAAQAVAGVLIIDRRASEETSNERVDLNDLATKRAANLI